MAKKKEAEEVKGSVLEKTISIKAPKMRVAALKLVGTAPYVQHAFGLKAQQTMVDKQKAGQTAGSKKVRTAKDFDALYEEAMHRSREGWIGMPASAFRAACISACRLVGFKMTLAKLAIFIESDGVDAVDGQPLVRINGTPRKHMMMARNANFSTDIRCRPMFEKWSVMLRVRYDADTFTETDVVNLISRVGMQVGIGEGRPDSRMSAGLGWGTFEIEGRNSGQAVA